MKIEVHWTVKNKGLGITVTSNWIDQVYWTKNFTTNKSPKLLSSKLHGGQLFPLDEYKVIQEVYIPKYIFGRYFIYVHTDARNDVFEHILENNNIYVSVRFIFHVFSTM